MQTLLRTVRIASADAYAGEGITEERVASSWSSTPGHWGTEDLNEQPNKLHCPPFRRFDSGAGDLACLVWASGRPKGMAQRMDPGPDARESVSEVMVLPNLPGQLLGATVKVVGDLGSNPGAPANTFIVDTVVRNAARQKAETTDQGEAVVSCSGVKVPSFPTNKLVDVVQSYANQNTHSAFVREWSIGAAGTSACWRSGRVPQKGQGFHPALYLDRSFSKVEVRYLKGVMEAVVPA